MVEEKMDKEEKKIEAVEKKDSTTPKSNDANAKSNLIQDEASGAGSEVSEPKIEDKKVEDKVEKKVKEKKKDDEVKKIKKTEAVVNGRDLRVSTKQAVAICNLIRGKDIDKAIGEIGEIVKMKKAVAMKGEIPHRHGKGMMSGRYPVKAAGEIVRLLKSLKANAINHEVELEKVRISCKANVAARPYRRFGRKRFKRSHVEVRLVPMGEKGKVMKDKAGESRGEGRSVEDNKINKEVGK